VRVRDIGRRRAALAACALVAVGAALVGCGQGDGARAGGAPSSRLVDLTQPPPLVDALDIDPATQDFLLTTNRGFFRIARASGKVQTVRATVRVGAKSAPVGSFLELAVTGPGRLVGSGHPETQGSVPEFLGVMESADGGRTWRVISRLGQSDVHKFVVKHDRLYAIDSATGTLLVSRDGGQTFDDEQFTPSGVPIQDFEVDPANPQRILAASDSELFASVNGGSAWLRIGRASGIRLAWPAPDALYRALKDGSVQRSSDGGRSWRAAGRVGGEPYRFKAVSGEELYLALSDGTIVHTRDGGRTWDEAFVP
jgi:photosystem II stability/assembly factor-like uncharacterized protein